MRIAIFYILFLICITSNAQTAIEEYVKNYSSIAVSEMKRSGVPASVTLAQGILESGCGNSYLATSGKNHFGIKCGSKWTGEKIFADDDAANECFRKYKNAEESYKDHSDFLLQNSRYASLFELKITDYKSWCYGLKKAGYATSPTYAEKLINLIEKHELYKYDSGDYQTISNKNESNKDNIKVNKNTNTVKDNFQINPFENEVLTNNNTPYIIVKADTDIYSLAKEIDLMPWQIRRYNDLTDEIVFENDIIYIKPKRNRADSKYEIHILKEGETMRDISQKYAVKLKKLYKKNKIEIGVEPSVGTKLYLRKNKK